jgi:hypothetical protein
MLHDISGCRVPDAEHRLGEGLARAQAPMQLDHQGHGGGVIQRNDGCRDPSSAERQQTTDETEKLVGSRWREHA